MPNELTYALKDIKLVRSTIKIVLLPSPRWRREICMQAMTSSLSSTLISMDMSACRIRLIMQKRIALGPWKTVRSENRASILSMMSGIDVLNPGENDVVDNLGC